MRIKLSPFAATFTAVMLLSPLTAVAQTQAPPATAAPVAKTAVSDQQITQAAVAMQKVMSIRQVYSQRLNRAKLEDRSRIATEGQAAMKQAVTDQGLSVDQYNTILQLAQNDPDVRAKLISRIPQQGTSGSSPAKP